MSMTMDSVLKPWAERLRQRSNLPVLVHWGQASVALGAQDSSSWRLGDFEKPKVVITIQSPRALPLLISPSLESLGEAYVEGWIDVQGRIEDILEVAHRMAESGMGLWQGVCTGGKYMRQMVRQFTHTPQSDREAIAHHYDVSNAFYQAWLDPAMVYSCAYFERGDETLEQAQIKKIDHILTKLQLRPGQHLLDIGCGWGALVMRAASKFGARCVGVTLSKAQFELSTERVKEAGLQHLVDIRLQDYREVTGPFDRISSVGMFEHVGLLHLPEYFQIIHCLLTDEGWVLNHGITSTDGRNGETPLGGGRFIDRYVFPQGELPHLSTVLHAMHQGQLEAVDIEGLRPHYARTTRMWSQNFEAAEHRLRQLVDDKRWRIWRVYLAGCQWAFEHDDISIYQVLCRKAGLSTMGQPWSRGWMYQ